MQKKNSKKIKNNSIEEDSARFKIISTLIKKEDSMLLSDIAKETGLVPQHVFYHLKKMKDKNIVIQIKDKEYVCQPLFIDANIKDDLDSLMKVITRIILRELIMPENSNEDDMQKAVIANLEVFIQNFAIEIMD